MLLSLVTLMASAAGYTAASPTRHVTRANTAVRTLYQFPEGTFVENLAVRSNGQLLVDVLTSPQLWLVDPSRPGQAVLVHEFAGAQGVGGIVEYKPDVFAVLAGNVSLATGQGTVGSWAVYSVDLAGADITSNASIAANPPKVSKIADMPTAQLPNGMDLLSGLTSDHLIVGDFNTGLVFSVDIETGDCALTINNTYTAPAPVYGFGTAATDGIKIVDDMLYFTNLGQGNLYRVPLNIADGTPAGDFETVATIPSSLDQWDDFTFDSEGNVFVVTGGANAIEKIDVSTGKVTHVAGDLNSTTIAEPTAAKFGRRSNDTNVLYVTTAGGLFAPVNGDITVGGQVLAIKTTSKGC
ncbi:hypothetical protein VMCG_05076 [Cytospora schulzeri]|uniref:SMP-30/Gluconolactonase/LRE-like region domain-containing protein n=1 Tax=Cytospora schulzeri TaxID=448051 RepID=A0A423WMF6_9PEZI|nr:hypothetical protein VMCG_05076 [Valsa malicola]